MRVVERLGYLSVLPHHLGMARWVDQAANHHVHLEGDSQEGIAIELHWNLVAGDADWRSPALDWFWNGAQAIQIPALNRDEEQGIQPENLASPPADPAS